MNSTALCMASTALISAGLKPRFAANSGENLKIMMMGLKEFFIEEFFTD